MYFHQFFFASAQDAHRASHSAYFECAGREVISLAPNTHILQVQMYSRYDAVLAEEIAHHIGAISCVVNIDPQGQLAAQIAHFKNLIVQAAIIAASLPVQKQSGELYEVLHHFDILAGELGRIVGDDRYVKE